MKNEINMNIKEEDMTTITSIIDNHSASIQRHLSTLLMSCFFPLKPFICKNLSIFDFFLKNLNSLTITALFAATDTQCAKYIIEQQFMFSTVAKGLP